MRRTVACLLFFLLSAPSVFAQPARPEAEPARLKARARAERLHESRDWDVLLHYLPSGAGRKSPVDDRRFFLAPDGKSNPEAELDATIEALFGAAAAAPAADNALPARCRFPARFAWLSQRLGAGPGLPDPELCGELDNALRIIDPRSATLVFASAYINSPSSMAGHTFLRVNGRNESPLLSWAVNYAAKSDPDDPSLLYALKGLTGFYPGLYSFLPYYEKVKEYGFLERRDLWEYRLNLTEEEVRRMVLHVLEMREVASDYFFFDENCSWNLLFLLEAARPEARLAHRKGPWVLPVETIEWVREAGLLGDASVRFSPERTIRHSLSTLPAENRKPAPALVAGTIAPSDPAVLALPPADRAVLLEAAAARLQLLHAAGDLSKEAYQARFLRILAARSALGDAGGPAPGPPTPPLPETAHPAGRFSLAAGVDRRPFAEVGYRPAYHALEDPGKGFAPASQIVFLDARLRYRPDEGTVRLSRLDILDIFSAAPRDALFKPWSWKLRAGLFDRREEDGRERRRTLLNPGFGVAREAGPGLAYAMAEAEGALSSAHEDGWSAGLGASAGFAGSFGERWPFHLRGRWLEGIAGDVGAAREREIGASLGFRLARRDSLSAEALKSFDPGRRDTSARLSWNRYF